MSATSVPAGSKRSASLEARGKGHIGLLLLASIAAVIAFGLLLVLVMVGVIAVVGYALVCGMLYLK